MKSQDDGWPLASLQKFGCCKIEAKKRAAVILKQHVHWNCAETREQRPCRRTRGCKWLPVWLTVQHRPLFLRFLTRGETDNGTKLPLRNADFLHGTLFEFPTDELFIWSFSQDSGRRFGATQTTFPFSQNPEEPKKKGRMLVCSKTHFVSACYPHLLLICSFVWNHKTKK